MAKFIALLRGINVGGHHKVPMAELKAQMSKWGYSNVVTLLNSGNIVFDTAVEDLSAVESSLQTQLESHFGFPIPVICITQEEIADLVNKNPFEHVVMTDKIRLYLTFLRSAPDKSLAFPWISPDGSFQILGIRDRIICSFLDLNSTGTIKGMDELEKIFGKNLTTRNYNTIIKLHDKM